MTDETNPAEPLADIPAEVPTENIELLKTERDQYLDGWKRAKADIANIRREALFASENARRETENDFLVALFDVADSFDMARSSPAFATVDDTWQKGFINTHTQLQKIFDQYGVTAFGAIGDVFDPMSQEPLMEQDSPELLGKVVQVIRKGYKKSDQVLRPAQIIIGK